MRITNKVAIITGAGRGIGEAIAYRLASEGVNLALVARDESQLKKVKKNCDEVGIRSEIFPFDLTAIDKIPKLIENILNVFPSFDYLVNNAGTYVNGNPYTSSLKDWDYCLDLNFRSIYHLTNQLLPAISKNGGAIINISSVAGLMTYQGGEIYTATKHALRAYSNCLFDSVREKNIKVTCLFPGYVNTDMGRGDNLISEKMIQPDDIAFSVSWAISLPTSACPTEITIRPQHSPYNK